MLSSASFKCCKNYVLFIIIRRRTSFRCSRFFNTENGASFILFRVNCTLEISSRNITFYYYDAEEVVSCLIWQDNCFKWFLVEYFLSKAFFLLFMILNDWYLPKVKNESNILFIYSEVLATNNKHSDFPFLEKERQISFFAYCVCLSTIFRPWYFVDTSVKYSDL